jgi:RHS repeat-associated protein
MTWPGRQTLSRLVDVRVAAGVILLAAAIGGLAPTPARSDGCPAYSGDGNPILDTQAAYNYACQYASADNGSYYAYGNDSANFVSQLMLAAGEHETSGFYWNQSGAWGTDLRTPDNSAPPLHSNSWASPSALYHHLVDSGVGAELSSGENDLADTEAGDLIFWDWNPVGGTYDDVSMVVSGDGSDPSTEMVASHIPDSGTGPTDTTVTRIPGLEPMSTLTSTDIGAYLHSLASFEAEKYGTTGSCPSSDSGSGGASGTCWSWHVVRLTTTVPPVGPNQPGETYGGWNPSEAPCQVCQGDPVNSATGEFTESATDISIPGRGPGLGMTRSYSSQMTSEDGRLGYGWTDGYSMSIDADPTLADTMDVHQENGSLVRFTQQTDGSWAAPGRVFASLVHHPDGSWTFTRQATQKYAFSSTGLLTSISDLNGETTTLSYASGKLTSVTDAGGRTLTFSYTGSHVTGVADSASRGVSYAYDTAGNLTGVTDLDGHTTHYDYDTNHELTSITLPRGGVTTNVYDSVGRVTSQTDPNDHTTTWAYDLDASLTGTTTITDPEGHATLDTYSNGDLTAETRASGTSKAATTTYEYDHDTNAQTSATDADGHTTRSTFDDRGNRLTQTDPSGRTTTWTYNDYNEVTSITPPATYGGQTATTTYGYDEPSLSSGGAGNLTTVSTPILGPGGEDLGTQTTQYDHGDDAHPGDVTSMVDARGNTWTYTYDSVGNKISESAPETSDNSDGTGARHNITKWHYDSQTGWITAELDGRYVLNHPTDTTCTPPAAGCTTYTHDDAGNVLVTTDGNGHQSTDDYDADGNLDVSTDADGHETNYAHDDADQLTTTTRPDTTTLQTSYWPNGEIKDKTDGAGRTTHYVYDALDHLASTTDPGNHTTTFAYDLAGNLVAKGDPGVSACTATSSAAGCTTYAYDAENRRTGISYHDTATADVSFAYDANGRRVTMSDGTGESTWQYDSLGRVTRYTAGSGARVGYGYDASSNVTSIEYPDGAGMVARQFDSAGRMKSVSDWSGHTTSFAYDASGALGQTVGPPSAGLTDANVAFGTYGSGSGQLSGSTGAAVDGSDHVWIADSYNNRLEEFSSSGSFMQSVGSWGSGNGDLSYPLGVAVNQTAGDVYVADYSNNRVEEFTTSGTFVRTFGSSGSGDGQLNGPYGIAVGGDGNVWVADTWNNRIQEFTAGGTFVRTFGSWGTGAGQMEGPKAICVFDGHVYVADTTNNRIEEFETDGTFVRSFGSSGSGDGQFNSPEGIAGSQASDYLYVTDAGNGRVEVFTTSGRFVRSFASSGSGSGHLSSPKGIAFSSGGDAFITDQGNNRVARWNQAAQITDTITSDSAGEISGVATKQGATTLASYDYSRDGASLLTAVTSTGVPSDTHTYGHDGLNRLSQQDSGTFSYDDAGLPTALPGGTSLTYDPAGRLSGATQGSTSASFSYDNKGERTSGGLPGAATATYGYDQAGELDTVDVGTAHTSYAYDGSGLRAAKTTASGTRFFTWDSVTGGAPLLLDDGGDLYLYGPDDAPLERVSADGDALWIHHDQNLSTRVLTDAAGSVVGTASYTATGAPTSTTGVTIPLGFNGQYTDAESGFIYLRARYYDPATAQFITVDPADEMTGMPYEYAADDPLDLSDASGLCPQMRGAGKGGDSSPCAIYADLHGSRDHTLNWQGLWDCPIQSWPGSVALHKIQVRITRQRENWWDPTVYNIIIGRNQIGDHNRHFAFSNSEIGCQRGKKYNITISAFVTFSAPVAIGATGGPSGPQAQGGSVDKTLEDTEKGIIC